MKSFEDVNNYIIEHWVNTIRTKKEKENEIQLPYPVMVPCETQQYTYFFYWDSYFMNIGLLYDMPDQALNNLRNMKFLVEKFGYIPNANLTNMLNRSQPPLYCSAVLEYYNKYKTNSIISEFYPTMIKEYEFWMTKRITPCGLNQYSSSANDEEIKDFIQEISLRGIIEVNDPSAIEKAKNLFAEAESGWDFSPRYSGKALNFIPVDLNSILYKNECILSKFARLLHKKQDAIDFDNKAKARKTLMEKLLKKEDGIFYDYDFVNNCKSNIISVANLLPYWANITNDKKACSYIINKLNFKFGLSACEKINDSKFQWDYPNMWPPLIEFAVTSLTNINENKTAKKIALKYLDVVTNNFEKSNSLFEKYSVITGNYSEVEYQSPKMMGWTAAVFRKLFERYYRI